MDLRAKDLELSPGEKIQADSDSVLSSVELVDQDTPIRQDRLRSISHTMMRKLGVAGLKGQAGQNELLSAVWCGDLETTQVLLALGVDKDSIGQHPRMMTTVGVISLAAQCGHDAIVSALITAGSDIECRQFPYSPLADAASTGHTGVVKILLAAGAEVDPGDGRRPALLSAARAGANGAAQALLAAGANVQGFYDGKTPLLAAIDAQASGMVKILLAAGADTELEQDGRTALLVAVTLGSSTIVRRLVDAGANIEARSMGKTPLQLASKLGHRKIVKILCFAGALTTTENTVETARASGKMRIDKALRELVLWRRRTQKRVEEWLLDCDGLTD